ncbi:hypothetical protein AXF42_Ash003653 [Apostasia shenzhenica]|uniref:PAR1 protein n=1 Tax=Apostasia shenzhenica TaxID=1088818 RepID=A0A2I0AHP5_9ASPA|nr:hypothetical protein AXF42_Ash003653 [Apostasia shenzhenica]
MASSAASKLFFSLLFPFALFASGVLGEIECRHLDRSTCAFAVSSSGERCVLEKDVQQIGLEERYSCRSSGVPAAADIREWIETDECIAACGLDRETVGISSDSLLDRRFRQKLCSPECYGGCPNIVDLYFNLAAGEGLFLPALCEANCGRREMAEINSSGVPKPDYSTGEALPPSAYTAGRKLVDETPMVPFYPGREQVAEGPLSSANPGREQVAEGPLSSANPGREQVAEAPLSSANPGGELVAEAPSPP